MCATGCSVYETVSSKRCNMLAHYRLNRGR